MSRLIPIVFVVMIGAACSVNDGSARDLAALRDAPLHTFDERELDAYLRWLSQQLMSVVERDAGVLGLKFLRVAATTAEQ